MLEIVSSKNKKKFQLYFQTKNMNDSGSFVRATNNSINQSPEFEHNEQQPLILPHGASHHSHHKQIQGQSDSFGSYRYIPPE